MIVMISDAEEIAMIQPLQGEAYLIIRADFDDGNHVDVKLSGDLCKKIQSYLAAVGPRMAEIQSLKPLGEPLN